MGNNAISLFELNNLVRGILHEGLPDMLWIRAETSDVRINQNGHCYLEFIEKDAVGKAVVAKARAMIWSNTFFMLKAYFESTTNQPFTSALKVLVKVSVEFHELYGFSLTVHDIDPSYTLGDQALNRAAILKQLEEEGVIDLNKELEMPVPSNRIAIISSPTAAGYEDFCNQLLHNPYGFAFYTKLFPAIMQGERAEKSIIDALEKVYQYQDCFDLVVIIRGGGATSELSCFDSYLLAASCAQFPLPIITGIGHERDQTVLDMVAHTRAKTPTAVAEFLISSMSDVMLALGELQDGIISIVNTRLQEESLLLNTFSTQAVLHLKNWRRIQQNSLDQMKSDILKSVYQLVKNENNKLPVLESDLKKLSLQILKDNSNRLDNLDKYLQLVSPDAIMKKGYTLTLKNGKMVKNPTDLNKGDEITTIFSEGRVDSIVKQ